MPSPLQGYTFGNSSSFSLPGSSSSTTRATTDEERARMGFVKQPGQIWNGSAYVYPDGVMPSINLGGSSGGTGGASTSTTTTTPLPAGAGGSTSLSELTAIADPWSTQRGQYQTKLSDLMKDPSSFLDSPMFKAAQNQGIEAINRSASARGQLNSGNRMTALMDYGQGQGASNFFKMAELLGGLGGANNQNPGGGLTAATQLQNAGTNFYNAQTARSNSGISQQNANLAQTTYDNNWAAQQQQQQDLRDLLARLNGG